MTAQASLVLWLQIGRAIARRSDGWEFVRAIDKDATNVLEFAKAGKPWFVAIHKTEHPDNLNLERIAGKLGYEGLV